MKGSWNKVERTSKANATQSVITITECHLFPGLRDRWLSWTWVGGEGGLHEWKSHPSRNEVWCIKVQSVSGSVRENTATDQLLCKWVPVFVCTVGRHMSNELSLRQNARTRARTHSDPLVKCQHTAAQSKTLCSQSFVIFGALLTPLCSISAPRMWRSLWRAAWAQMELMAFCEQQESSWHLIVGGHVLTDRPLMNTEIQSYASPKPLSEAHN